MQKLNYLIILSSISLAIAGCNSTGSSTSTPSQPSYSFVVDAGSSGCRIHVYSKTETESNFIVQNLYESLNLVPLASFATHPEDMESNLIQPLLTNAIDFMENNISDVNLNKIITSVLGTAGMRLISESEQSRIYSNIATTIVNNNLKLGETKTISGQEEGLYSWIDINYLQDNFSNNTTNGIIEVGGASAQIAFATNQELSESVIQVTVNNKNYNVYSVSFLGLGQNTARDTLDRVASPMMNACYPVGYKGGNFNMNMCTTLYHSYLQRFPELSDVATVDNYSTTTFVGLASVYFVYEFWNIENQPEALVDNINNTCYQSLTEITQQHPGIPIMESRCANAVYMNEFLFDHLGVSYNQLQILNTINENRINWTQGYVLVEN